MSFFDEFFKSNFSSDDFIYKFMKSFDETLGEKPKKESITNKKPTKVETYEEDGYKYEKKTWEYGNTKMTEITMVNKPKEDEDDLKSLESKLTNAVENQEFELAIELRDKIKKLKK